ncbi:hypothetical protein QYF36_014055 [Acer negundo]|nr:hypothetical protein QYF36_014055 [Acer negundo]
MDPFDLQLAKFNREMELFVSRHLREERSHDLNSSNRAEGWESQEINARGHQSITNKTSQMSYELTLNGCEEVGKEEIDDEMKEPKPYVPPTTFPSRLLKHIWNKLAGDKHFQDLIAYKRKVEALEFG